MKIENLEYLLLLVQHTAQQNQLHLQEKSGLFPEQFHESIETFAPFAKDG